MTRPAKAGRKPGVPNKLTADIKAVAFKHAPEAIAELQRLMKDPNPAIRLAAADKILDRAVGKAAQPQTGEGGEGPARVEYIFNWQK